MEFVEVGPRDGLQNEPLILPTHTKVELIRRALAAGARRIEVASFVNPLKVPQMADAEAVVAALPVGKGATFIGLTLNLRGAERALATGIDELGAVCVASDTFGLHNQGQDRVASLDIARKIVARAREAGRAAQITIAVAFGCPFEGEVDPDLVVEMAREAAAAGVREVSLADTIGVATPAEVERLVAKVRDAIAPLPVRVHFHDTRNTGNANVWAALGAGARVVDASIGGLGGCPFALGASGNIASEDVVYMLERSGVATGMDLSALVATSKWLSDQMDKTLPAMVSRSPLFPTQKSK